MQKVPIHLAVTLLAVGATSLTAADKSLTARLNQIVILTDDLGYADVGFNGCKDIPTPNIDAIAKSGVRFASGYAPIRLFAESRGIVDRTLPTAVRSRAQSAF